MPDVFAAAAEQVARIFARPWVGVMRYDGTDSFVVLATWGEHPFPVGSRWPLDGPSTFEAVLRTGRPAAVSDYTGLLGTVAEAAREAGVVGGFGAPIVVDGSTWGVIAVPATRAAPVPKDAETRLAVFTELVATAISNATARDELARLAAEQAALRRIATLVARESSPVEVFVAVCEEARQILGSEAAGLLRFEPGGTATLVAQSQTPWDPPPLGTSFTLDGRNVVTQVFHTARAARADDWTDSTGAVAGMATVLGVRSAVAAPVIVEGRLWGIIIAATSQDEPLPGETERRLEQFTELIATAIANAEARDARAHLAEEQAALRRVATLVAQQPSPEEIFEVVSVEVARVFGFDPDPASPDIAGVVRFEPGPALVPVGASKLGEAVKLGVRFPTDELYVSSHVLRTSRPARVGTNDLDLVGGETADWFRNHGLLSQVGSPIVVEGRLWGAMTVNSGSEFPADTEERLERFTNLIATAIANAETRDALALLAEEQAALRRVATLVAVEASQDEIFNAIAAGVAGALGEELRLVRFEGDIAVVVAASEGPHVSVLPVRTRLPVGGNNALSHVFRTGEPTRIDDYSKASGPIAEVVRAAGLRSIVATPIVVEGRTWGAMIVGTFGEEPVPPGTEGRLGQFAELMATSIANTEARSEIDRLAGQEAALRRIATLVAQGPDPDRVFAAVTDETAAVFNAITAVMRFEHDPPANVIVGVSAETGIPIGTRWPLEDGMTSTEVYRTGRSARLGAVDWASHSGPVAQAGLRFGVASQVACPIVVEGSLWGVITLNASDELPGDTEERLEKFTELVTTAIANATNRDELLASRARIVAAGDDARRRVERNLHDGTQQRLIALGLDLQRVRAELANDQHGPQKALMRVEDDLKGILMDLRELSHGLHPPLLSRLGLGPSLQALARRSPIPVRVDVNLPERPAESLETAVYYVVSEALTNAIKHSQASEITVTIAGCGGLKASIVDDGIGGADPSGGSGLTGLFDRVDALGGQFACDSPPRGGTRISVELPVVL